METIFNSIKVSLDNHNPKEAEKEVDNVLNLIRDELEDSVLNSYIITIFNEEEGLINLLKTAIQSKTNFKNFVSKSLHLIYIIVNNFPKVVENCCSSLLQLSRFVIVAQTSFNEKINAFKLIKLLLQNRDIKLKDEDLQRLLQLVQSRIEIIDSQTVSGYIVTTLGEIAKHYSHIIPVEKEATLLESVINQLHNSMQGRKVEKVLIESCFECLNGYLTKFSTTNELLAELYSHIKQFSVPEKNTQKSAHRAGLALFSQHNNLFKNLILQDKQFWLDTLRVWITLSGDDYKTGWKTLDAVYISLADSFKDGTNLHKQDFLSLLWELRNEISQSLPNNNMRLTIRALGHFSEAASKFLTPNEMNNLFIVLIERVEYVYIINSKESDLENLPDYIQTLSNYITHLNNINLNQITSMQKVCVLLIKVFPKLSVVHYNLAVDALVFTMYCITRNKLSSFEDFLYEILYQGVIWSSSHNILREVEMLETVNEYVTFKNFLPLWNALLKIDTVHRFENLNITKEVREKMVENLFNELMKILLILINKLNLDIKYASDDSTEIKTAFHANNNNDLIIFVNMVDLYVEILENVNPNLFHPWIITFSNHLINKSNKFPLISGFYKLLTAGLKISNKLDYFNESRLIKEHVNTCFHAYHRFIENTLGVMQHFKEDLLLSCIELIIAAPANLINLINKDFIPIFNVIFTEGRSYVKIAQLGVETLERWYSILPEHKMVPLLKKTLPCLDSFLRSESTYEVNRNLQNKTKKNFMKIKVDVETKPELLELQHKILNLIAQINSELCMEFINTGINVSVPIWNKNLRLKVALPYNGDTVNLYLDKFLPRIIELAIYSSDRKTKIGACELLHAMIMVLLGTMVKMGEKASELNNILKGVADALIYLGCDGDDTVQQIFLPLVMQMMHWYAHPKQMKTGQIVLDSFLLGNAHPTNAKIRDFSGQAIKEFIKWTRKQNNQKSLIKNIDNVDYIIQRLYYFGAHPDPTKRLGAALIFNNVYSELREEELLINKYWLSLLKIFIVNLSVSHSNDVLFTNLVLNSLNHLMRVFNEKADFFNKRVNETIRPIPLKFQGNTLKDVATFLLENTTSNNQICRSKCIEMFLKISNVLQGCNAKSLVDENKSLFFESYKHSLKSNKTITQCLDISEIFKYMQSLLCVLDGLIFVYKNMLLPYNNNDLILIINYYLKEMQSLKLEDVVKLTPQLKSCIIDGANKKDYDKLRVSIVEKILNLSLIFLENYGCDSLLFNNDYWTLICNYIFNYFKLGYEDLDREVWKETVKKLINLLISKLKENLLKDFLNLIKQHITSGMSVLVSPESNVIPQTQRNLLNSLILLKETHLSNHVNVLSYLSGNKNIFKELVEIKQEVYYSKNISSTVKEFCDLWLQLALNKNEEFLEMVEYLRNPKEILLVENNTYVTYGMIVFKTFPQTILNFIIQRNNFELVMNYIIINMHLSAAFDLFNIIVQTTVKNKSTISRGDTENIVNIISQLWFKFIPLFNESEQMKVGAFRMIESLAALKKLESNEILNWLLNMIVTERDSTSKEQKFDWISQCVYVLRFLIGPGLNQRISSSLSTMKDIYMPLFLNDENKISTTLIIRNFFESAKYSKSIELLIIALDLHIATKNDFTTDLDITFKTYFDHLNLDKQLETLDHIFENLVKSYTDIEFIIKSTISLNRLLNKCNYVSFQEFYVDKIRDLLDFLQISDFTEEVIKTKIRTFILLEALFARINIDNFATNDCPITLAAFSGYTKDGKRLIKTIISNLLNVCKEDINGENNLIRLYHCYAHNALISVLCNCQTNNFELYNRIFSRFNNGTDILWCKLIDLNKVYKFEIDFDEIPKNTKRILNIRTKARQLKNAENLQYIESQHLFLSTLNEDIGRYDFLNTSIRLVVEDTKAEHKYQELEIFLTEEDINTHECMSSLCGTLRNMESLNILNDEDVPVWIMDWRNILLDEGIHKNIKLFFMKVIENNAYVFKRYAKFLIGPITKAIGDGYTGDSINSFVCDMMVMMLSSWFEVEPLPEDNLHINSLIKFLINNVCNDVAQIYKYNLKIIQLAVEHWKDIIEVPYNLILKMLEDPTTTVKYDTEDFFNDSINVPRKTTKLEAVIQVINIFLVNNLTPWETTIKTFAKCISTGLEARMKTSYHACAETIGLSLKHVSNNSAFSSNLANFEQFVKNTLRTISLKDDNRFMYCLDGMVKHYTPIIKDFLKICIFNFEGLTPTSKCVYLRIFMLCSHEVTEMDVLHKIDFNEILNNSNFEVKLLGLEFINKTFNDFSISLLESFINNVCSSINDKDSLIKSSAYDLLIKIHDKFGKSEDETCLHFTELSKNALIEGLAASDSEIKDKILEYWLMHEHLPNKIDDKLLYLLENMYKSTCEYDFLAYTSHFLLKGITEDEKLFEFPLHDCEFHDYEISSSWKSQHSSMVPMFVSTQFSQSLDQNILQATQTLQFENTLATLRSSYSQSQSYLVGSAVQDNTEFKDPNDFNTSQNHKIFKRKFHKDKSKTSQFHAYREIKKSSKKEEFRKEAAKKRERGVRIYRKYRAGDFPDIEITLSAIISPLCVVAKYDGTIAKLLHSSLFEAATNISKNKEFIKQVGKSMNKIFNETTLFTPNFMGYLMEIASNNKDKIRFDPSQISIVSQNSGLLSTGCLLLEGYLSEGIDSEGRPSKRGVAANLDEGTLHWIKLAELYKEMEDWDMVRAIFLEKTECPSAAVEAMSAESNCLWKQAKDLYMQVVSEDVNSNRKDFYYECCFKCMAELSEWKAVGKCVEMTVATNNTWDELWDQDWNQEKLLPFYINYNLHEINSNEELKNYFFNQLNKDLKDSYKKLHLKQNFAAELAFIWIYKNSIEEAEEYINHFIKNFLHNWSCINPLFTSLKGKYLLKMRNAMDINLFIKNYKLLNKNNFIETLKRCSNFWEKSSKEFFPSIIPIETRNVYRKQFAKMFESKLDQFNLTQTENTASKKILNDVLFELDVNLIEAALQKNNFQVAQKYASERTRKFEELKQVGTREHLKCYLTNSKFVYLKARSKSEEKLKLFQYSLKLVDCCINNTYLKEEPSIYLETTCHLMNVTNDIFTNLEYTTEVDFKEYQNYVTDHLINSPEDIEKYGVKMLNASLNYSEEQFTYNKQKISMQQIADAFLKLARFILEKGEKLTGFMSDNDERVEYENQLIHYTLKAMLYESAEASYLFPHLLSLENLSSTHKDHFIEQTSNLPVWLFIQWIPQLLVYVNSEKVAAISHIIIDIAMQYPNSIIYAYKLSKEKCLLQYHDNEDISKDLCVRLDQILQNPHVDLLLESLSYINTPKVTLLTAADHLLKACTKSKEAFDSAFSVTMKDLFERSPSFNNNVYVSGRMYKNIEKFKTLFNVFKGKSNTEQLKLKLGELKEDIAQRTKKIAKSSDLNDYSPWLENFRSSLFEVEIEIPGQYKPNQRPLVQYHVKIASFDSKVTIFHSIREPIRITILGSDTKEYKFLVKCGEDLRQDQRIQQLFTIMNGILRNDPDCFQRKLNIATYEVIPLTSNLGIIEWVSETSVLKDFIIDGLTGNKTSIQLNKIMESYNTWLKKAISKKDPSIVEMYVHALLKYNSKVTIENFKSKINMIPTDTLRKAFINITSTPEHFFSTREKFIRSYAVMCVSNWLVGIGDRHLGNILISMESGEAIGIDFGHAFGTGTELAVPELIPFRLTPQIVNLMEPMKELGILQETMIHALRALRQNCKNLLSAMNIFIQEPTLNWLENIDTSEENIQFYPAQKISFAKAKFEGEAPYMITIKELEGRKGSIPQVTSKYIEYIKGCEENYRFGKDGKLSAEEQVKCLIDQATDYNLLGRMWVGWEPWI